MSSKPNKKTKEFELKDASKLMEDSFKLDKHLKPKASDLGDEELGEGVVQNKVRVHRDAKGEVSQLIDADAPLTKEEEFITQSDKKGVKIFGSFDDSKKDKKFNYSTIIFISDQNLIEIVTVYEQKNDIVEQIVKRIENSIDFVNG